MEMIRQIKPVKMTLKTRMEKVMREQKTKVRMINPLVRMVLVMEMVQKKVKTRKVKMRIQKMEPALKTTRKRKTKILPAHFYNSKNLWRKKKVRFLQPMFISRL